MSYHPFVFVKSYQQRVVELKSFLSDSVKASQVQSVWSSYVELLVEPIGWRAMWKISRDLCSELKIKHPSTVTVSVEHVNAAGLSCFVSSIEVEDESLSLPESMNDVPLIHLYPLKEQDTSLALSKICETAELLDTMRFFYNHLWMPWDLHLDADDEVSWVQDHLESRLRLHFLMQDRKLPHDVAHKIRQLVGMGRRVQAELEDLQEELMEVGEEGVSSDRLLRLTELHNTLCHLRSQHLIYEKPELLKALLERKKREDKSCDGESCESLSSLVLAHTTTDQLAALAAFTSHTPANTKPIRVVASLQEALVRVPAGSTVWLTKGEHHIQYLGVFESGGTIIGVEPGVVITDDPEGCFGLDIAKGSLTLSNLTLRLTSNLNIIKVRGDAECHLRNVTVEGSAGTDGIDIYSSASLTATKTRFANCNSAVICDYKSLASFTDCSFVDNNIALEVNEGVNLRMEQCRLSGSKKCGVQVSVSSMPSAEIQVISDIKRLPQMKETGTICEDNRADIQVVEGLHPQAVLANGDV